MIPIWTLLGCLHFVTGGLAFTERGSMPLSGSDIPDDKEICMYNINLRFIYNK